MARNPWRKIGVALAVVGALVGGVSLALAVAGGSSPLPGAAAAPVSQGQQADKAWLGILLAQTPDGPAIAQVIADSPADKAGLQRGDVIEAVDGTGVANVSESRDQLDGKNVGDTVTLSISRDGQAQDVSVTLEARPEPLPQSIPLLPELEGIPADELFSHFQGGEFNYSDANGKTVTVAVEAGTVASVDATAGKLTVNLNAGGSKTYTVEDADFIHGGQLSDLKEGDNVTVMTVGDDVRAVFAGGRLPFIPGAGGKHGGFGFGHGRFRNGDFRNGGHSRFSGPESAPQSAASGTGL